jgi:type II secretory pathway pseudopilin PulG
VTRLRRIAGRPRRDDEGTSVLEVTLAAMLFSVVLVILLQGVVSLTNNDSRRSALNENTESVRVAVQQVARDLRAANPLVATDSVGSRSVSANEVILKFGPTTATQTIVNWRYDSTAKTLNRCTRLPSATAFTCTTVLGSVTQPSSSAVFRYFCTSGAELNPAGTNGPNDIAAVGARVRVALSAAPNAGPAPLPVEEDAQVRIVPGGTGC